ncbi:histidinol-phosphate transaminase [Quisquiliibacterium transsilvanicum]|uniref:Histidinol-phosphate aminotransferase n=1 Tax=Quisquiliibacterium transsilvanicum TaxID=1549638 RepID=A0A7W8HE70_9BURK|nr:histidinol-phosphate transaminase [Quisquiliibacterium transsilvanicum]MBB5270331.1 histidinol-phosphate aminotransferase [Quisquiliibacterium transsilvanicum]
MNPYWSPVVRALTPYVPGEQPVIADLVKLNTNENPYPPSPLAIAAMQRELGDGLRLYPDPQSTRLRHAIAAANGVEPECVFVGNGSDEVLAHAFLGLLKHEAPLCFPDVTYSFYPVYCGLYGIAHRTVPLREDFSVCVDDYAGPCGGIVLANPNAPTGRALPLAEVERLVAAHPECVVLIDEAYVDFGGESAVPLVARHPNLLVVQTLSKSRSLAGLRVGFAIGQPGLIEALVRVKDSFNSYPLDKVAIAGAVAAFEDVEHFERTRSDVIASREALAAELASLGFQVLPSAANFLFVRHETEDAARLQAELRARRVLVRRFDKPRIEQFLRITVGDAAQCAALVAALRAILVRAAC